ncbi:hypothetical protein [Deminuibacter soli]|uniref:Uncharacterized protein n=1 Tax=Deminuibacter soli TaxID=2291815 RepID=A0A3E1NQE3_9BACT|nr:hypothetical protein [Deminuibacter soli]RFM30018.1 hypothetical protein DXN05_03335 [Deminuibacter soli]
MIKRCVLLATAGELALPDWGEKLTMVATLGFFLYYFMKELREVRNQMDSMRKEYEQKHDAMFDRVVECEKKSTEALNRVSDSTERLTEAVDSLTEKLQR